MNKDLNKPVVKDVWMAEEQMRQCSTSLLIRKLQIRTKIRYHDTIQKLTVQIAAESADQQERSRVAGRIQNGSATWEYSLEVSHKTRQSLPIQSRNHTPRYLPN